MKILNENEGYKQAFYEIAEILCIGARPDSPKDVFEQVIKPMLINLKKECDALETKDRLIKLLSEQDREQVVKYCLEQIDQVDRADENIRKASNAHQYQWLLREHHIQRIQAQITLTSLTTTTDDKVIPVGLNRRTAELVMDFAKALAEKLLQSERKYGWSDGWLESDWQEKCLADFHQHISKGDPRDVAAYCAFMWYHGWPTQSAPAIDLNAARADAVEDLGKRLSDLSSGPGEQFYSFQIVDLCKTIAVQLRSGNAGKDGIDD